MACTINGQAISRGSAVFPWTGLWRVDARLTSEAPPPARGERVTVQLGDLKASGTVTQSGTDSAGRAEVMVMGGANGWIKKLPIRWAYRMGLGVPLRLIVADIARDIGETVEVAPELQKHILGESWTRPAISALMAMKTIRVNGAPVDWHVRPDGVTWVGPRVRTRPEGIEIIAPTVDVSKRWARLTSPTDSVSAMLPGNIIKVQGLPTDEPICTTVLEISGESLAAVVHYDPTAIEFWDTTLEAARQGAQWFGCHVYQVLSDEGVRCSLKALSVAQGLPQEVGIIKGHGLPGASTILSKNTLVLLTWRNGDPACPTVVGYLPGKPPEQLQLDVLQWQRLAPSVPDLDETHGVHVGGGRRPVAMGDAVEAWAGAAHSLLQAIVTTLAPADGTPLDVAAKAEEAAYLLATNGLGFSSTKLGTR